MKVVHISYDVHEASANVRIQEALRRVGVESSILVYNETEELDHVYVIEKKRNRVRSLLIEFERIILDRVYREKEPVLFSPEVSGVSVVHNLIVQEADIIHLHWVCGHYMSAKTIKQLKSIGKPIAWTFHDSWPMTGGCHVRYGCEKFVNACGNCPMLGSSKKRDLSYFVLKQKLRKWRNVKFTVITPSRWMLNNVRKSALFSSQRSICIPNPIDTNIFFPKYGGNEGNRRIKVLFGASGAKIPYKGYTFFVEVLNLLFERNSELASKIEVHIFGTEEKDNVISKKYPVVDLGYVKTQMEMATIYQDADVYIFPSLDDNLPGTVMESLACGTPVLAFDTGGVPEMVEHKRCGYIAKYKDVEDLYEGLVWILNNNSFNILGKRARDKIKDSYSFEKIGALYYELYEAILNDRENKDEKNMQ